MRIITLLVTGLFWVCSTQAMAQANDPNLAWAKCMATYRPDKPRPVCDHLYVKSESPGINASPDYEFQAWKANELYKRDVEAINRNYDLRRSGLLP